MRFAISKTRLPVTALLLALCARPAAAQQGEVTGRVIDKTSGTALATAQVSVVGTTIRALTGQDGRYRLVNVPAGPATLRVAYIGYATTTQEVSVPAGSVLYGTDAANGAIVMRTRRGQPGATKWTMSAEGGTLNDYGNYPDNYTGLTALDSACALTRVVATLNPCVQVRVRRFNPIEQRSPFRTGHRVQYGISASGGSEQTTFYLAGHFNNEDGVYPVNWNKQVNLLANLFDHVRSNMDIQATALYTSGRLRLPQNDNNVFGVLSSGFLGGSDSTANNGYGFLSPAQSFSIHTFQNIDHFTGSLQANYRPLNWLEAHAVIGTDFLSRYDENTTFPGIIPASFNPSANQGNRNANPFQIYNWTGNFYATASFALTPTLNSTTSGGLLYYHLRNHGVLAGVQTLTSGTNSLSGGVIPSANEQTLETLTIGRFAEERLG